ncbi:uncharacterized protein PAC_01163 [Phialocephala subalpina]|uniref:Nephrocystin 3-like N-terminal domain-containing protein n=1 Tax=Phialocephala subalpina TaxID=576137 RepID=A0A1L7WEX4_9HELO|nr:uncharacterized protein PAC_01163 [Phialocephala subalpina]
MASIGRSSNQEYSSLRKSMQGCEIDTSKGLARNRELRQVLANFDAPLARMSSWIQNIHDNLEKEKRRNILDWISDKKCLDYIKQHKESKREILQGTDDSASSLIWLHGIPGSGKTKLVSIVIEEVIKISTNELGPRPAFVFCSRNPAEHSRSDSGSIISSIARQISNLNPSADLLPPVVQRYEEEEEEQGGSPSRLDVDEMQKLVLELVNLRPMTVIIIDALDECSHEVRRIVLDFILCTIENASSLIKFFVSSRYQADIFFRLQNSQAIEISSTGNSADIKAFVEWKIYGLIASGLLLRESQERPELHKQIVKTVTSDAYEDIRGRETLDLTPFLILPYGTLTLTGLEKMPPTLQEVYAEIYNRVNQNQDAALPERKFRDFIRPNNNAVSTSQVLDICCNLVVLDETSQIMRQQISPTPSSLHCGSPDFWKLKCRTIILNPAIMAAPASSSSELENVVSSEVQKYNDLEVEKQDSLFYHLARAGVPGRKDRLIEALARLPASLREA